MRSCLRTSLCEADHRGEDDLAPEEERAICKYALEKYGSDFVFVTHFPSEHRAFYAMDDPEDPTLTLSFDLLMRGLEITSGGQRIHKEADYREKMLRRGMNPEGFPLLPRHVPQRHAASRRFCYRTGAYHGLLPGYQQRERM